MPAVEYTKAFTISVVMGKDVVPRIGLHQMEALRADLINAIKRSVDPKVVYSLIIKKSVIPSLLITVEDNNMQHSLLRLFLTAYFSSRTVNW